MTKKAPFIVAISGVGGAGKDSVLKIFKKYPDKFAFFVSYTDRPTRADETPGETYHYISKEEFSNSLEKGEFLEWEQTRGEYRYGRKKDDFEKILHSGKIPVMNIDVLGLQKFKKIYKTLSFFILPPSKEEAMARMQKRGTDSPEAIKHRIDRYDLELSYKDKYDHVIVNDTLERAQNEVIDVIEKKLKARQDGSERVRNILLFLSILLVLGFGFYQSYANQRNKFFSRRITPVEAPKTQEKETVELPAEQAPIQAPPAEIKKKIAASPPKYIANPQSIVETKKNSDDTITYKVATGSPTSSCNVDLNQGTAGASSPSQISYDDQTGLYSGTGPVLKEYWSNTLKWKGEIGSIKKVIICDAGDTGWSGQYIGQYTVSANGRDIIGATGLIVLNSTYYKDSPIFNDYMKLILSHEYGHHYTLYHKWVDWDLPVGERFPDSYYTVRPLSKATTATDYSKGWKNCEVEIIAEDYSYLYSGYGIHSMSGTYGFPSSGTKVWLSNIGSQSLKDTAANNPPTLEITSPSPSAILSGSSTFSVSASDDVGIDKVGFYVGSTLLSEDSTAPYEATINTQSFANGTYVLRAVASDGTLSAEKAVTVAFQNETTDLIKPTIAIISPADNPFTLNGNSLDVRATATDNVAIDKIEFYFGDSLQGSWQTGSLNLRVTLSGLTAGTYVLKFRAYDTSGNTSEATLSVVKQ